MRAVSRSYDPPVAPDWFVVNARDAEWRAAEGRGSVCVLVDDDDRAQFGVNLIVLANGEPMAMYHWEADQEDFLVVAGEALLIVEGEERPLRRWDFVHCPAGTRHVIVGASDEPCVVVAVGAREHQGEADWGAYTVDEAALRHGAGVEQATTDELEAYSRVPHRKAAAFREAWLPG
jgi:uncharacterized cupin superfamily protein